MIKNVIKPRLLEVGHIKIGKKGEARKSQGGGEYRLPEKLPYFLVTTMEKDSTDNFVRETEIMESLKKNPDVRLDKNKNIVGLPIRLLYNDIESNFPTRLAAYNGTSCICSGDGETATTSDGKQVVCPCQRFAQDYPGKDKCKCNGTLTVILDCAEYLGACYRFRTTSRNTVESILGSLHFIKAATGGTLAFLPLHLMMVPKTMPIPNGKGVTTVYIVSVVYRGKIESLQKDALGMKRSDSEYIIAMKQIEMTAPKAIAFDSEEDERDFAEEFYANQPEPQQPEELPKDEKPSEPSVADDLPDFPTPKKFNGKAKKQTDQEPAPTVSVEQPETEKKTAEPDKKPENGDAARYGKLGKEKSGQLKRLISEKGLDPEGVKAAAKMVYGVDSATDIDPNDFQGFYNWVETLTMQHALWDSMKKTPGLQERAMKEANSAREQLTPFSHPYQFTSEVMGLIGKHRQEWEREIVASLNSQSSGDW